MRYTHALDYDELDTMAEIWTPDCEFNVDEPAFQARGRDQVVALLRETRQGFPRVRHVVTNCLVEAEPGGALVRSYLHILDLDKIGRASCRERGESGARAEGVGERGER